MQNFCLSVSNFRYKTTFSSILGPVKNHLEGAKSLFPPVMPDMCKWASTQAACPPLLKNRSVRNLFSFDMVATQNDYPRYVKHSKHFCSHSHLNDTWCDASAPVSIGLTNCLGPERFKFGCKEIVIRCS